MHVLILADGDASSRASLDAAWPGWDADIALVVAADGGARHAAALDLRLDRWVGDGDSIDRDVLDALRRSGIAGDLAPVDKDESDTELAITEALRAGATRLSIVGALGGPRFDHALANVGLLALPGVAGMDAVILTSDARIGLITAPDRDGAPVARKLVGRVGDPVSLLPMTSEVTGVTTAGLRYPLDDEPLLVGSTRGLSNVRAAPVASVTVRSGRLLVVESPATL